jgi:hypothetical protein
MKEKLTLVTIVFFAVIQNLCIVFEQCHSISLHPVLRNVYPVLRVKAHVTSDQCTLFVSLYNLTCTLLAITGSRLVYILWIYITIRYVYAKQTKNWLSLTLLKTNKMTVFFLNYLGCSICNVYCATSNMFG